MLRRVVNAGGEVPEGAGGAAGGIYKARVVMKSGAGCRSGWIGRVYTGRHGEEARMVD